MASSLVNDDRETIHYAILVGSDSRLHAVEARISKTWRGYGQSETEAVEALGLSADKLVLFRSKTKPVPSGARSCLLI